MNDPLTRLAILYGTDKFGYHDYTPNYYKLLKHLQNEPIKILEIGVGGYGDDDRGGQSLEVWRDFFPKGEITGIDIQKKTMDLGPRVQILQGSQVDADFLEELVTERGPFDVIIDDGSHRNEHVVESYRLLFPTLKPGGIYAVEDVQTSFHPRFGGTLEMTAPNSVGYFGELMQQFYANSEDPLIHDVAGMERFHNIIAMHKKADSGKGRTLSLSNRFEIFDGKKADTALIGKESRLEPSALGVETSTVKTGTFGKPSIAKGKDLIICTLDAGSTLKVGKIETMLEGLAEGGILALTSSTPEVHFAPDSDLMIYTKHRFTMVDHVEIKVHFPDAAIDDLAKQIFSMEVFEDGVLFYKSPNTYPSNFAYDVTNPQAAAALAHIGDVLKDSDIEGGLVQYADLLSRHTGLGNAKDILSRLNEIGATSRKYFQMAGIFAQRERRKDDVLAIAQEALKKFPFDPQFSVMASNSYVGNREYAKAEVMLRGSFKKNPRARDVISALSHLCNIIGETDEAIALGKSSINMFPKQLRPMRLAILARMLRQEGRLDEAGEALDKVATLDVEITRPEVYIEMAELDVAKGETESAEGIIREALQKWPDNRQLQNVSQRILT